jgi:enterobactin synthetase component D / holo-[acyl-carrier protein] synthase
VIARILPHGVVAVEAREDDPAVVLFPAEEAAVGRPVEKRRREFTTARACARQALAQLGLAPVPIVNGPKGEPLWPPGVVGSVTHCEGYRGVALAHASAIATIGIDAEPHLALPEGVLDTIADEQEQRALRELHREHQGMHWDRLLFSAKESVYKAWFPLTQRWLGFEDAQLSIDPASGTFEARLLVAGPDIAGRPLTGFSGRWVIEEGLILTAIVRAAELDDQPQA